MKIELDRKDICNLMLACTCLRFDEQGNELPDRKHWGELHDKLKGFLSEWDEKHKKEV